MFRTRALFVGIEALRLAWDAAHRGPLIVDSRAAGLVSDSRGLGFDVVVLRDSPLLCGQFVADGMLSEALTRPFGARPTAVLTLEVPHDPRQLWEAARRWGLDLDRSWLVTEGGRYAGVCTVAGVRRVPDPQSAATWAWSA